MGNAEQGSETVVETSKDVVHEMKDGQAPGKSGALSRLVIIVGVFVVVAGGILGYQQYLKSQIPQGDKNFSKELAEGSEPDPETSPSGMSLLTEIFSDAEPSKEILELQGKTAEEVVFTYDAIMKMTDEDLNKNIKEVSQQLASMRESLPPSIGGASAGASEPPEDKSTDDPVSADQDKVTIPFLALPLEVMRQIAESRK